MQRAKRDFDAEFFRRYYADPRTRVADGADGARLAALISGISDYLGVRVRRILDAGCGVGLLRAPLLARFPRAAYQGLEVSRYLCERYGWRQGTLQDFAASEPFDLLICHDVLQYLEAPAAARAIANLRRLSRGVLYFSVLTRRDWRQAADQVRTDRDVHLRNADWYQRRLRRGFRHLGCGVHLRRDLKPILWELETAWA
jgi:2-polyprenyl-3-methyl-5-hydroxy-6-metoxy-1,4-benzoquinol methylase